MKLRSLVLVLATGATACGGSHPPVVMSTHDPAEYPFVLLDPKAVTQNFMVRQNLKIHAVVKGEAHDGEFDAVLQKQGDSLVIIGFGPMNVKAFTLEQHGDQIKFEQFMGPKLPFSPRNVVVDVQRVFFKHLPPPTTDGASDAKFSGQVHGELDGETLDETWTDGQLRAIVAARPAMKGAIRVELGPGCTAARCEPENATLRNEWFDYTLRIANEDFQPL